MAQWLETAATAAARQLQNAEQKGKRKSPEFRRITVDVALQVGIGRFFASKIRSALLWEIYEASGNRTAGEEALNFYRKARETWAELVAVAKPVYVTDISYGPQAHLRGNWSDRLPAIDQDIADMEHRLRANQSRATGADQSRVAAAVQSVNALKSRPVVPAAHTPPKTVRAGDALPVELSLAGPSAAHVYLHYRHVNQAESWAGVKMEFRYRAYRATIPGEYTNTPYPLQYYFEIWHKSGDAGLYPGLDANLANQPYFVVRLL